MKKQQIYDIFPKPIKIQPQAQRISQILIDTSISSKKNSEQDNSIQNQQLNIKATSKYQISSQWKPENRQACPYILQGDFIYSHGGIGQTIYEDVHIFNIKTQTWQSIQSKNFIGFPRYSHVMVKYEQFIFVFGGICKFGKKRGFLNDLRIFDNQTQIWDILESSNFSILPRFAHSCTILGEFFIVFGGITSSDLLLSDIHIYNVKFRKWIIDEETNVAIAYTSFTIIKCQNWLKEMQEYGCYQLSKNHFMGQDEGIWIFGGRMKSGVTNKLHRLILGHKIVLQEIKTKGNSPQPRIMHGACYMEDKGWLVIHGGKNLDGEVFGDLWCLNMQNFDWTKVQFENPIMELRAGHSIFYYDNELKILGGFDQNGYKSLDLETIQISKIFILVHNQNEESNDHSQSNICLEQKIQKIKYIKQFTYKQ